MGRNRQLPVGGYSTPNCYTSKLIPCLGLEGQHKSIQSYYLIISPVSQAPTVPPMASEVSMIGKPIDQSKSIDKIS